MKTEFAIQSGSDQRCALISVRVTPRELAVVDALVRQQRCSRSQAVRWLAFFGAPPSIPALNQQAFEDLDEVRSQLVDLKLDDGSRPSAIPEALKRIEIALERMRSALLPSP